MSPAEHDEQAARISHLPHALAVLLVLLAARHGAMEVAATGFRDTTRVASGDPEVWTDIFHTNREAVAGAIDAFTQELSRFRVLLTDGGSDALTDLLRRAKDERDSWLRAEADRCAMVTRPTTVLVMLAALPLWGPPAARAQTTQPAPASQAGGPGVPELFGELRRMRALLESMDERLRRIEGRDGGPAATGPAAEIDTAALRRLSLPADATPEQVQSYIDEVLRVSARQTVASPSDPQVEMLARVGPQRADALIQAAVGRRGPAALHLVEALKRIVGAEHKRALIEALPRCHELIGVVVAREWEDAARQVLISELQKVPTELPPAWIEAVARLKDPSTYAALRAYLVEGANRAQTYNAIKRLPGLRLEDAVAEAWQRAAHAGEYEAVSMATIAADYGHLDALDALADALRSDQPWLRRLAREALLRHVEIRGSDDELRAWLAANRGKLRFEADSLIWRVPPEYNGAATQAGNR
jgi:hypothetical protein